MTEKEEYRTLIDNLKKLMDDLDNKGLKIKNLEQKIEDTCSEIDKKNEELENLKKLNKEYESKIEEYKNDNSLATIQSKNDEIESLIKENKELVIRKEEYENEIDSFKKKSKKLERINELENEIRELDVERVKYAKKTEEMNEKTSYLECKLEESKRIAEKFGKPMDIEKKMEDYQKEINNLKIEVEKKEHMHDPYIKDLEDTKENLTNSNASLKKCLKITAAALGIGLAASVIINIAQYGNSKKEKPIQIVEIMPENYKNELEKLMTDIKDGNRDKALDHYIKIKEFMEKDTTSYEKK